MAELSSSLKQKQKKFKLRFSSVQEKKRKEKKRKEKKRKGNFLSGCL
jgi:hypothetical protein